MLICCQLSDGKSLTVDEPAISTRPSAGDRTAPGAWVATRSGSRKKNRKLTARTRKTRPRTELTRRAPTTPRAIAAPTNGQPAGSIRTGETLSSHKAQVTTSRKAQVIKEVQT